MAHIRETVHRLLDTASFSQFMGSPVPRIAIRPGDPPWLVLHED